MSEWIKCSERLPEDGECVLVIANDSHSNGKANIISVIYNAHSKYEMWIVDHFCEYSFINDVEYWMPLPELPE